MHPTACVCVKNLCESVLSSSMGIPRIELTGQTCQQVALPDKPSSQPLTTLDVGLERTSLVASYLSRNLNKVWKQITREDLGKGTFLQRESLSMLGDNFL